MRTLHHARQLKRGFFDIAVLRQFLWRHRKSFYRWRNPIIWNDLTRPDPIGRNFGAERGTPIDRIYIESFLDQNRKLIQGTVLEIAADTYSVKFGGTAVRRQEILHVDPRHTKATIHGDLTKHDTLPQEQIDCFICTQTLNVLYDLHGAVAGAHRMLRPGGAVLATVPGISQISRSDMDRWGDYWRFTDLSARLIFEEAFGRGNVTVVIYGNAVAACAFVAGVAAEEIPDRSLLFQIDADYQVTIGIVARKTRSRNE